MVRLKLQRIGKKKQVHFRLIAQDRAKDPQDKSVEILGWINPHSKEKQLKKERIEYWLSVGAQPTESVHNLLVDQEIIKGDKKKTFKISNKRAAKSAEKDAKENEDKKAEDKPEEKKEEATEETKPEEKKEEVKEEVKEEKSAEEKK